MPSTEGSPCTDLLAEGIAVVEITASVSGLSGEAFCGDVAPVRLSVIRLRDGGTVELRPAALVRCEMAHTFARWVRDDLAAALILGDGTLARMEIAASYTCRPRNNVSGARLSEHGLANAIDLVALVLSGGRRIAVDDNDAPATLLAEMRRSACARFTTVLGPGSDAAHEHHVHVDLARRRGGYRMCQWNMPNWPLP
ncbi:MAG: extensin family protein [Xanthobacteraceae bacterium]